MYAVTVTFEIVPGQMNRFMPLMQGQADTSLEAEEGCLAFDICRDSARPQRVFLYEIYTDKAAFDLHLASDHFRQFDADVADMVAEKTVITFDEVIVGDS